MGLSGDKRGAVAVSFTKKGALFLYNTLMGDSANDIGPEVIDAIGELTNIISGQARKELERQGLNLKAAIPLVVTGKELETSFITKLPIISLPFYFSVGNGEREVMYVDFSFE
jgi:chemotaxis protein CheX